MSILELTSQHISIMECNSIQTILCLSYTKVRAVFTRREWMHELWWKALPFIFAVSTLASQSDSPNAERFTFPLGLAEPKKHKMRVWATEFFSVRWAESGGWCYVRLLKWPSFGCLSSKQKPFIVMRPYWLMAFSRLTIMNCINMGFRISGYPRP